MQQKKIYRKKTTPYRAGLAVAFALSLQTAHAAKPVHGVTLNNTDAVSDLLATQNTASAIPTNNNPATSAPLPQTDNNAQETPEWVKKLFEQEDNKPKKPIPSGPIEDEGTLLKPVNTVPLNGKTTQHLEKLPEEHAIPVIDTTNVTPKVQGTPLLPSTPTVTPEKKKGTGFLSWIETIFDSDDDDDKDQAKAQSNQENTPKPEVQVAPATQTPVVEQPKEEKHSSWFSWLFDSSDNDKKTTNTQNIASAPVTKPPVVATPPVVTKNVPTKSTPSKASPTVEKLPEKNTKQVTFSKTPGQVTDGRSWLSWLNAKKSTENTPTDTTSDKTSNSVATPHVALSPVAVALHNAVPAPEPSASPLGIHSVSASTWLKQHNDSAVPTSNNKTSQITKSNSTFNEEGLLSKNNKANANIPTPANKAIMPTAGGVSLQTILQRSLASDPVVEEAWANELAAQKRVDSSFSQHYPKVSVSSSKLLGQSYSDASYEQDTHIQPSLNAQLNLFSWGAISDKVNSDRAKERYFYYKYYETRNQLGNTIAKEYLNALFSRDMLIVLKKSLERHQKIIHDLKIIVKNDSGRRFELVQAQARAIQVQQMISDNQTALDLALGKLSKYIGRPMTVQDLRDPFPENGMSVIKQYTRQSEKTHPTYLAQQAELESVKAQLKSEKAKQLPSIGLEANAARNSRQVYLNFSWNLFDRPAVNNAEADAQSIVAAQSRLDQIDRDIEERSRLAKIQMQQSSQRYHISKDQIEANTQVVHDGELQFKIGRKSLIELLNAYSDLSGVEVSNVKAKNDMYQAILNYLYAQGKIAEWAKVPASDKDKRLAE